MKSFEEIENRIETIQEVITFASLIKLDITAITNLKSFIKILEWVLGEE